MDINSTRVISMIHFTLLSLFIFFFVFTGSIFLILQQGIGWQTFDWGAIQGKALYINCHNGIRLTIDELHVYKSNTLAEKKPFDPRDLSKALSKMAPLLPFLRDIDIENIHYNGSILSLRYTPESGLLVHAEGAHYRLDANVSLDEKALYLSSLSLEYFDTLHVTGSALFDLNTSAFYGTIETIVANADHFSTYMRSDSESVAFRLESDTHLTTLPQIVALLPLHPLSKPWMSDYIKSGDITLHPLTGTYRFAPPHGLLQSIDAYASVTDAAYEFARGFKPATAKKVDVRFRKGKLEIEPHESAFYDNRGDNTDVAIDFNPEHPLLQVHIDTSARLDDDIVRLIRHYGIDLPLKQRSGSTRADLTLSVDLETEQTTASGTFAVSDAAVLFHREPLFVHTGSVILKNNDVLLKDMNASYRERVHGILNAAFNPAKGTGLFKADITEIRPFGDASLQLQTNPLHVSYEMVPKTLDRLKIPASIWQYQHHLLHVDAIDTDFDYHRLRTHIPPTAVIVDNTSLLHASSTLDLRAMQITTLLDLHSVDLDGFRLDQNALALQIGYDRNLTVSTPFKSQWRYKGTPFEIGALGMALKDDNLTIDPLFLGIDQQFSTTLTGFYSLPSRSGHLLLDALSINNNKIGALLHNQKEAELEFRIEAQQVSVALPSLDFTFKSLPQGWEMQLPKLSQMARNSPLMQEYNITQGSLTLGSKTDSDALYFHGNVDYAYPILVQDDTPQTHYRFEGRFEDNRTRMRINNAVTLEVGDDVSIFAQNAGLNVMAFVDFLKDHTSAQRSTSTTVTLDANQSYLYFTPQRRALADTIHISSDSSEIFGSLIYKKGGAGLEMRNGQFYLYGQHFNDTFMNHLLAFSTYKGGQFSFAVKGTLESFKGVARIDKSRLKEYVVFNNVLAFINTIPALASFSLPGYAKAGIPIKEAYAAFEYKDAIMHFDAVKFDSDEMDFYGKGIADYPNNRIDMELSIKTQLGSNVSQLPVVGYILVGDDGTAMTTVNIKGPLQNPEVSTGMAKDIVIAPFNILKRAVTYPFHLIDTLTHDQNETQIDPTRYVEP